MSLRVLTNVAQALVKMVLTLFLLSIVTYLATSVVPSDPAQAALGKTATEQQLVEFRKEQGLDKPIVERYTHWIGNFVKGDWGTSLTSQQPVREVVSGRLLRTIELALIAFALAVPIGIGLGLFTGQRSGSAADRVIGGGTLVVSGLPEFVIGILLLAIFGVWLAWLPVESSALAFSGVPLSTAVQAFVLPAITLSLTVIPYVLRMMRANTREIAREPFVRAAALRGVRGARLSMRHMLPNALAPVVNVLALNLAELIAGVVAVEAVFAFPGAGQLLVSAVQAQDIPTVQALVLLIGAFFIALNLIADLALIVLNPRLRT